MNPENPSSPPASIASLFDRLTTLNETLGFDHPDTARLEAELGRALLESGDLTSGLTLLHHAAHLLAGVAPAEAEAITTLIAAHPAPDDEEEPEGFTITELEDGLLVAADDAELLVPYAPERVPAGATDEQRLVATLLASAPWLPVAEQDAQIAALMALDDAAVWEKLRELVELCLDHAEADAQ